MSKATDWKSFDGGTCQICGRAQKTNGRGGELVMALHGYRVLDGWFSGGCPGAKHEPYELSCALLKSERAELEGCHIPSLESTIKGIVSDGVKPQLHISLDLTTAERDELRRQGDRETKTRYVTIEQGWQNPNQGEYDRKYRPDNYEVRLQYHLDNLRRQLESWQHWVVWATQRINEWAYKPEALVEGDDAKPRLDDEHQALLDWWNAPATVAAMQAMPGKRPEGISQTRWGKLVAESIYGGDTFREACLKGINSQIRSFARRNWGQYHHNNRIDVDVPNKRFAKTIKQSFERLQAELAKPVKKVKAARPKPEPCKDVVLVVSPDGLATAFVARRNDHTKPTNQFILAGSVDSMEGVFTGGRVTKVDENGKVLS